MPGTSSLQQPPAVAGPCPVEGGAAIAAPILRPVQYLGSKLRALEPIVASIQRLSDPGARVLDAFTGSTVVAQAAARTGRRVLATDSLQFPVVFARALLGIGKRARSRGIEALLQLTPSSLDEGSRAARGFARMLDDERAACLRGDADALLSATRALPQIHAPSGETPELRALFSELAALRGASALDAGGLVVSHYAGTYFGLEQALAIDELRVATGTLLRQEAISAWEGDVLLTALLSAASDCAFTPGKHFAQPHRVSSRKDLTFLRGRVLQDRRIDVRRRFAERARLIHALGLAAGDGHGALCLRTEDYDSRAAELGDIDLIYADPPYTAQQYSRFYHVPEVITRYEVPVLQEARGRATAGLYPAGRYLSPFCSKRRAPAAFGALAAFARSRGASLVVSYSAAASDRTGNARMIGLDQLVRILREAGQVEVAELSHEYRQFNSDHAAMPGRWAPELLVVCKVRR